MRVVLDCRHAYPHLSGIGRYATTLAAALSELPSPPTLLLLSADPTQLQAHLPPHPFTLIPAGTNPRSPRQLLRLPKLLRSLRPDIFHTPDAFAPVPPLPKTCPTVITIHDLIPLVCPQFTGGLKAKLKPLWASWLRYQAASADAVLTCSRHSASDIQRLLHITPTVIYPGVNPSPPTPSPAAIAAVRTRLGLDSHPFLLFVGRREPYKNIEVLIQALHLLTPAHPTLRLVLTGHRDPQFPQPERLAASLGVQDRLVTAGHLSDPEVAALYSDARALCLLSFYEGFGYPPLEALAHRTPVLTSPLTSLPETLGPAATYANPTSPQEVAHQLHHLLCIPKSLHPTLQHAPKTLAQFTPKAQAEQTLKVYEQLLGTPPLSVV